MFSLHHILRVFGSRQHEIPVFGIMNALSVSFCPLDSVLCVNELGRRVSCGRMLFFNFCRRCSVRSRTPKHTTWKSNRKNFIANGAYAIKTSERETRGNSLIAVSENRVKLRRTRAHCFFPLMQLAKRDLDWPSGNVRCSLRHVYQTEHLFLLSHGIRVCDFCYFCGVCEKMRNFNTSFRIRKRARAGPISRRHPIKNQYNMKQLFCIDAPDRWRSAECSFLRFLL